ncbi:DUF2357 domain-containing protein [Ideonella sp.]|uniref:DUF2357 domain-containing protein n=1 Tax=Ideonella sp. TaxID=1929293 RepID=UPI0035B1BF35
MTVLHLIDERGGARWKLWPDPAPLPAGAIQEARNYLLELEGTGCGRAELDIDDQPLAALRTGRTDLARWRWSPGFYAGFVEAAVRVPGRSTIELQFLTDPEERKLSRECFDQMVGDILEDSFSLLALSGFRFGVGRGDGVHRPPIARLEFLRSRIVQLEKVVQEIARKPRQRIDADQATLPYYKAIRATPEDVARSFRRGRILKESPGPSVLPEALNGALPATIQTKRRFTTADTPENRQVVGSLRLWAGWLADTADVLLRGVKEGEPERQGECAKWARRCRSLSQRVQKLIDLPAFADVGTAPIALRLTSVFRRDPAYRSFYALWQDISRGIANIQGDFLNVPLARTFDLYEVWCYLRIARAAGLIFGGAPVSRDIFTKSGGGALTIRSHASSIEVAGSVRIHFQRSFREYWLEADGRGSFTRTMTPDLVISAYGAQGRDEPTLIVLDAKYRVEEALNDAIASIHMYRDAIVEDDDVAGVRRVVRAAYVLTPHLPATPTTSFQETPAPARFFHPAYRGAFQFGAIALIPGTPIERIGEALQSIIKDACGSP